MQKMKKSFVQFYLFVSAISTFFSFYIFYIWFRNTHYHPKIDDFILIPSKQYELHPELDIQLYLTGIIAFTLFTPIATIIYSKLLQRHSLSLQNQSTRLLAFISIVITCIIWYFSLHIGQFGSTKIIFLFLTSIILLIHGMFVIIPDKISIIIKFIGNLFSFVDREESKIFHWLNTPAVHKQLSTSMIFFGIDILVIIAIIVLVSQIHDIPFNDYHYFLGPVNDVLHGKTLLINSPSQYGFLLIYFLAFVYKYIPLTYTSFFWVNFAVIIAGYFILYWIIKTWTKSRLIGILSTIVIIDQHYFHQIGNILFLPQVGFMRFGWWIILLFFLLYENKLRVGDQVKSIASSFIVTVSVFWGLDSGLYVIGAYCLYITTKELRNEKSLKKGVKNCVKELFLLLSMMGIGVITISLIVFLHARQLPNWQMFSADTALYSNGFGMIPIPAWGPYLIYIGIYLLFYAIILYKTLIGKSAQKSLNSNLPLIAFVVGYGMFQFIYYVGRSHPNNLQNVIIPLIVLLSWVFPQVAAKVDLNRRIISVISLLAIIYFIGRNIHTPVRMPNIELDLRDKSMNKSLLYLQKVNSQTITLISQNDTWFLVQSKKINSIDSNNLNYFILMSDMQILAKQIDSQNPRQILIDHQSRSDQVTLLKSSVMNKYQLEKNIGYLDIWHRKSP